MRPLSSLIVLISTLCTGGVVRAESVTEPSTGFAFEAVRTVDGHAFALVGTGVRKKIGIKVYAMAIYVAQEEARRAFPMLVTRAGGGDRAKLLSGDHAQQFVIGGAFPKLGVLHFVRDVGADKMRGAFQDGLTEELSDRAAPELKQAAQAFVALFQHDMKTGEEIVVHTLGDGRIEVMVAGTKQSGLTNPKLARAIWAIWLGAHPISTDMRRSLVERIDLLGK